MICLICNREFKSSQSFSKHIKSRHNIITKDYYDIYLKQENENKCALCGKETPFLSITKGYQNHCSAKCAQNDSQNLFIARNPKKDVSTNTTKQIFKKVDFTCKLCSKTFTTNRSIVNHMRAHKISIKDYWRNQNHCIICGQETQFINASEGYSKYCCIKHRNLALYKSELNLGKYRTRREEVSKARNQFESENTNLISYQDCIDTYGQGWLSIKDEISFTEFKGKKYVDKSELYKIEEYVSKDHYTLNIKEQAIVNSIKEIYKDMILTHEKHLIKPLELDVYLPKLKIAIEYNGNIWHCIENGREENYHLIKSIKCREKEIRLIHIYEFEDFDRQLELLNKLILGKDEYPENDFNKNNFIKIPTPAIIYSTDKFTIYGAGPLI